MTQQPNSSLILCSTPRLARSLQQLHQRAQLNQGLKQWSPLNVKTLSQWLTEFVEEAVMLGELDANKIPSGELTALQEGLLWEQAIKDSLKAHEAKELFDTAGLASAAIEANRYIIEWNLSIHPEHVTEETQQFLIWRQRFQTLCNQHNQLEAVRFANWRLDVIEKGLGVLPSHISFAGFDAVHPQLARLQKALKLRGVEVETYPLTLDVPQKVEHVELTDQDAECRAAIAWAQQHLIHHPQAKIAIVVPELNVLRAKLVDLLDDAMHSVSVRPALSEIQRCYDFSLGTPLHAQPMITAALNLLRLAWQEKTIFQNEFAYLLHSPYWSQSLFEADARALLDARIRKDLPLSFKVARLQTYVQKVTSGEGGMQLPALSSALQALLGFAQSHRTKQPPSTWTLHFQTALQQADWPGQRGLSSVEYQAKKSFESVLAQLAGLDALLGKLEAQQAIYQLTKLCQAKIFQPESKTIPALQVMGMMEAAAAPLDAMWVMGMNDHIWPPVARPNALIPANLQRAANTPNASSEVQTAFAQAIHQRLIKSAHHVIFSSAQQDGDRELRPSPLLSEISKATSQFVLAKTLAEQLEEAVPEDVNGKPWDWMDDQQAPAVEPGEHVSGGTGLLKAQAICPAWAFYQYRLNARALKTPVEGLDAMDRGTLVHGVLELFWKGRDSQYLKNLNTQALQVVLEKAVEAVLAKFNAEHDFAFSEAFIQLEKERLVKLVTFWLMEVELQRPQDFEVLACEQENKLEIEGVRIKLVVDRLDQLADGRLLVMDYKTGNHVDFKNWGQVTITEPQLPIYAAFLLQDQEVGAVCFAKVNLDKAGFAGISASQDLVQGVAVINETAGKKIFDETRFPDWPSVIQHWRDNITQTAIALKNGQAQVQFEDEKQLTYCEVLPLLRLAERQLQFEHQQSLSQQKLGKVQV